MRYVAPVGDPLILPVPPRLASWNASGHPDQVKLGEYLAAAERLVRPRLDTLAGPLVLKLDVGLPAETPLLVHHDLDNYLFPLASYLVRRTGRQFVSAWATKQTASTSFLRVDRAQPVHGDFAPDRHFTVRTTASSQSAGFKQQIHDQLSSAEPIPEGPVSLHLTFTLGPGRNWMNLWKPAIDAFERILGRATPERPWHPRDDRIVELGLHSRTDTALRHDVSIDIAATEAERRLPPHP